MTAKQIAPLRFYREPKPTAKTPSRSENIAAALNDWDHEFEFTASMINRLGWALARDPETWDTLQRLVAAERREYTGRI
jgi:hypothetical protein